MDMPNEKQLFAPVALLTYVHDDQDKQDRINADTTEYFKDRDMLREYFGFEPSNETIDRIHDAITKNDHTCIGFEIVADFLRHCRESAERHEENRNI